MALLDPKKNCVTYFSFNTGNINQRTLNKYWLKKWEAGLNRNKNIGLTVLSVVISSHIPNISLLNRRVKSPTSLPLAQEGDCFLWVVFDNWRMSYAIAYISEQITLETCVNETAPDLIISSDRCSYLNNNVTVANVICNFEEGHSQMDDDAQLFGDSWVWDNNIMNDYVPERNI